MGKITDFERVPVEKLKPYKNNAKMHSEEQVKAIARSIEEFGFLSPCLIDREYNLIAGHGRVMACKELGITEVPCVFAEGLTDAQRRAYILADNRLTEMGAWDQEKVSKELNDLFSEGFDIELTGFSFDDINDEDLQFTEDMTSMPEIVEEEEPKTKTGQIWRLGNHRLMCGDSTSAEDMQRLMGGEQADLVVTDPPYNVDYSQKVELLAEYGMQENVRKIENDDMPEEDFIEFMGLAVQNMKNALREGGAFYMWYASVNSLLFQEALRQNDMKMHQILVWVKNQLVPCRSDYQWIHEPCLYGWKEGKAHYFTDDRRKRSVFLEKIKPEEMSKEELVDLIDGVLHGDQNTVLYENKPLRSEEHPTMKPVNLIARLIANSTRQGEKVLDMFGGSGTTLIASEQLGRKCFMMEYEPHYCDVIIDRWERLTGDKAELITE